MVGWHHRFNGHEFEQVPGESEGQQSLACCGLWGHKESDTTEWLHDNHQGAAAQSGAGSSGRGMGLSRLDMFALLLGLLLQKCPGLLHRDDGGAP